MAQWYRRSGDAGLIVRVHAQPGAKRTEVAGLHGESLKIRVAAPALEDRANEALVAFLAERFSVPKRDVKLVGGAKSREKRFEILGAGLEPGRLLA